MSVHALLLHVLSSGDRHPHSESGLAEPALDSVNLAAAIRARHGLKTPDALQEAACCLQLGANHVFLSGDKGFRRVPGLNVHVQG